MKNNINLILTSVLFLQVSLTFGQKNKITIPKFKDKYCEYVKQLESGKTDIDYTDFRNSFLESEQHTNKSINYDNLKKEVYKQIKNENYNEIIKLTQAMLSIDYTSMFAHMYLQKTYKIIGDSINRNKYHDIEFGLINSITKNGDGNTCETGWHVTQIEEEYFIINVVLGGIFQSQGISSSKSNMCDKMEFKTKDGTTETIYFEANKVFELEKKLFGK